MSEEPWRRTGGLVPDIRFSLLDGGTWSSRDPVEGKFKLLTIYRGKWCGQCKKQLTALDALVPDFNRLGVSVVAVSADTQERASEFSQSLSLKNLSVGYEFPMEAARQFGTFVSAQAKPVEMPLFSEPASFLIGRNYKIFAAWIASCAYARTPPEGMLEYVEFIGDNTNKVPRGSS